MSKKKKSESREENRLKLLEDARKVINEVKHLVFTLEHEALKLIEYYDMSYCLSTLEGQYRKILGLLHALSLSLQKLMQLIRCVYADTWLLSHKNYYENATVESEAYY